jgi:Dolichyl-phosphate-mannose-protein mannosyltransferase
MADFKLQWTERAIPAEGPLPTPVSWGGTQKLTTALATLAARFKWRYPLVSTCLLLYLYPFLRALTLPVDEGWCLTDAMRVYHGQVPYRDFFEMVGPGTFYWIALFFNLFGETWLATRVCVLVGGAVTALLIYFLARRLKPGSEIGVLVFWLAVSFPTWPAVNHHLVSNLFALMAFSLATWWLDSGRPGVLFICGMSVGITSSIMLQKGVLLGCALVLTLLSQRGRPQRLARIAELVSGSVSVAVGVAAYFWARGGLSELIYANFVWPLKNYNEVGHVSYGFGLADSFRRVASLHSIAGFPIASILSIPFLVVLLLPLILVILALHLKSLAFASRTLPFWLVGSALWISEAYRPDMFHLVPGSPVLLILCFSCMYEMRTRVAIYARQIATGSAAILASATLLVCLAASVRTETPVGSFNAFVKNPVIDFTNSHVKPGQTIFVYPYAPIYYFLSGASNPTRFSFLMYKHHTREQMLGVLESLEKDKTRYVIWDTTFETVMAPTFLPAYRAPSNNDRVIEPYLNEHYKEIGLENGFRFMERINPEPKSVAKRSVATKGEPSASAAPDTITLSSLKDPEKILPADR